MIWRIKEINSPENLALEYLGVISYDGDFHNSIDFTKPIEDIWRKKEKYNSQDPTVSLRSGVIFFILSFQCFFICPQKL